VAPRSNKSSATSARVAQFLRWPLARTASNSHERQEGRSSTRTPPA
jgi:hypothetical protein